MSAAVAERSAALARVSSDVSLAARFLAPAWPIETFIAVNPLGGLEDLPFGQAVERAGDLLGARGTMGEPFFRAEHARGRITDGDLRSALALRGLADLEAQEVELGALRLTALELLLHELRNGREVPAPARRLHTVAELCAPDVAAAVDSQASKWCAAYLDVGQAGWTMPGREQGFYDAWAALARHDRSLPRAARSMLAALPPGPEEAVLEALEELGIARGQEREYLQAHLARLPGWAAHVRWRGEHLHDFGLVDYLAMRLLYERALLAAAGALAAAPAGAPAAGEPSREPSIGERVLELVQGLGVSGEATLEQLTAAGRVLELMPPRERALVWLEAYEGHYRDGLVEQLSRPAAAVPRGRPDAQLVCCIDARSEGLRRHLESVGSYETLGFAGFFAVAIRYRDLAGGASSALCPVLLEPANEIRETPRQGSEEAAARALAGRAALAGAEEGFHASKDEMLAPFALAEASGWLAAPLAAGKTLTPGGFGALRGRLLRRAVPAAPTVLGVEQAFSFEERALFAEVALTMMGLTSGFAPLVVLCGHGSTTENNPYEAALDCGACGGNRGAPNARVAAAILNGADVRTHLAGRGIEIPPDTWFVAAEHDTATDTVSIIEDESFDSHRGEQIERLRADLGEAGRRLAAERCGQLPSAPASPPAEEAARHVRRRSSDWSEVFPEWGLAGNAAFIVAPRSVTAGLDLGRRAFLHSYDAEVDPDGAALETILTAPLVVAQWINCQYYFSAVDPVVFGAGAKTIHNVVAGVGVLAGHNGDLQLGLPWQSLADGRSLVHEPMRLLALVQAPLQRIETLIARNTILQHLFGNGWVALAARERDGERWLRYTTRGFEPWQGQEEGR